MPDLLTVQWRISDKAIATAVAEETVILHVDNGNYYGLDPIGARLWDALKVGDVPAEICPGLLGIYEVTPERLETDLRELLCELTATGLIEPMPSHT